jgi:hypothetical protein
MKYFLLVYDRKTGQLSERLEFAESERARALAERFARERVYRSSPDIEVILIGADSVDSLKQTHARYFLSPAEIVSGWLEWLSPGGRSLLPAKG